MIKRFLAVMAASAAMLGSSAGAALAQYPPAAHGGAVSATSVGPGGHVQFSGGGFRSGSRVRVSVNNSPYTSAVAGGRSPSALGSGAARHMSTAAYTTSTIVAAAASPASFSVDVTLSKLGSNLLTGAGVAPDGTARVVTATVVVAKGSVTETATGTNAAPSGSSLPFTGSSVVVPGLIIGLSMLAGGFLLLTTVRSRRAGLHG